MTNFSAVIRSHDEAISVLNRYQMEGNESIFIPYIRGMTNHIDEQTFAIMQGSGNEMSPFDKFLYFSRNREFISKDEGMFYIKKPVKKSA